MGLFLLPINPHDFLLLEPMPSYPPALCFSFPFFLQLISRCVSLLIRYPLKPFDCLFKAPMCLFPFFTLRELRVVCVCVCIYSFFLTTSPKALIVSVWSERAKQNLEIRVAVEVNSIPPSRPLSPSFKSLSPSGFSFDELPAPLVF